MKKVFAILSLFAITSQMMAQDDLALGQWRSLLPYTTGKYVTQTDTEVWYAADRSILIFDKEEMSTSRLDKVGGLSDVDVRIIEYSPENQLFVATYNNSNIDIISEDRNTITNMNEIERDIELQGDKTIYDIYFLGNAAYLATGFGVMKINLDAKEVESTTFMNIPVNDITSIGNVLYAATSEGIYYVNLITANILDFSEWGKLDTNDGYPDDYNSRVVHAYNGKRYVDINDTLFVDDGVTLEYIIHEDDFSINYLQDGQENLYINIQKFPFFGQKILRLEDDGTLTDVVPFWCMSGSGSSMVEDEQGRIWVGDYGKKFIVFNDGLCDKMEFNSPFSVSNAKMHVHDDVLWVTGGSITQNWQYGLNRSGLANYNRGEWTVYNEDNTTELDGLRDVIDIEVNPRTGVVYAGSFLRGLLVYDGNEFIIHNTTSGSPLTTPSGDTPGNCRVPGIAIADDDVVWMANHNVPTPVVALRPDGNWKAFPIAGIRSLVEPTIDQQGNKWFKTSEQGVVIFNEGDDWDNDADNQVRFLNPANSELPTDIIFDITMDQDGDIWVGTSEGIVIFECGGNVFDSSCRGTKRVVEREDGNNAFLLESENVRCITVDGANRKWVGTTNGVFLLSEDGFEELAHLTRKNSPLFSDIINDITINPRNGEVFIGTADGILSYMGDATEGFFAHSNDVFAFPNPVEPDYEGPIAIRGLAENATVKITDISGKLVYETESNGGQAIWDGKDYNGEEAASGVYLVFSVNEKNLDNPDGYVTKILKMK